MENTETIRNEQPDPADPQRIVLAFFDVLGFSRRLTNIGLSEIYREYKALIELVISKAEGDVRLTCAPDGSGGLARVAAYAPLKYFFASDTIIFWAEYQPYLVIEPFLDKVLDFFCEALIREIPLRGCITFGDAIMDTSSGVFLGSPIVEAANGEKAQAGIGVSFGLSVRQPPYGWIGNLCKVIPFSNHIKRGCDSSVEDLVLDWPRHWRNKYYERLGCDMLVPLRNMNTDSKYSTYYEAAEQLAEYSLKNKEWWKNFDFKSHRFGGYVDLESEQ